MKQCTLFAIGLLFVLPGDINADNLAQKELIIRLCNQKRFERAQLVILACPQVLNLFEDGEKNPLHYGALENKERFVGEVYDKRNALAFFKNDQGNTPYQVACLVKARVVMELFENIVNDEAGDRRILDRR